MSKVKTASHGKFFVFLFLLFVVLLYGFGLYSAYDIMFVKYPAEVEQIITMLSALLPVLSQGLPYVIGFFVAFFVICLILGWIILQFMKHTATFVVLFMAFLFPFVLIAIGAFLLTIPAIPAVPGIFLLLIGGLLLFVAIWNQRRLRRAGKFVSFSAQLVLDEKALLLAPIAISIFTMFAGVIMGFSFLEIWDTWGVFTETSAELSDMGSIVALAIEYIYLIVYFGLYYIIAGMIVSYAFDWYRKEDPSLRTAWRDVRQVLAPLIWFGIIRATLEMITRLLGRGARRSMRTSGRSSDQKLAAVVLFFFAGLIVAILIGIYRFFTYFTLPAIVIKKKGVKDSIKDSAKMVWNNWLDLLVGETGFGLAMLFFNIINMLLWAAAGLIIGYTVFSSFAVSLILAFVMLIFSTIPMHIVTYPMGTAFKTFMYAYALDRASGFKQPSRLPADLRGEFNDAIKNLERKNARRKIPQPSF
ncbi:MAG: hypothetical protein ACTSW1_16245 [Candidatus Hodarchaeales archaeon]